MNPAWIAVAVSALGLWPTFYAFRSAWRTRTTDKGNIVFQNALELAKENRQEANHVRKQLLEANKTIDSLTEKLKMANKQIFKLTEDVYSANAEVAVLRNQIDKMSQQVNGEE